MENIQIDIIRQIILFITLINTIQP